MTEASKSEPTHEEIRAALRAAYRGLIEFASTNAFQALLAEIYALSPTARPGFVNDVIMNSQAMRDRGIVAPPGILIQRSSFGDRRPTLFCIKMYIPEQMQSYWQNANITFDNEAADDLVPRDERAWRPPLSFDVQQALVAGLIDESMVDR